MLKFDKIEKKYGQQTIVKNISFHVRKGELAVLIGPSGCGKTTLLKMINRLIKPTAGEIYLNGEDIMTKDEIALRRGIGYVIQQTGLFPHMTVRENIEIIPKLQKQDADKITAKSIDLMHMVGLDPEEYLDRYPTQLSGGQQQRIGVARAFACDPDVILMDEPFSALDPITRSQLQDELVDLQSKVKKTIVFVTHDMDEAIKIADKICIINQGTIVQFDTPEEIMKNPANDFAASFIGKTRIWTAPELIRAEDIMITKPICSSGEATALRCIEKMRSYKIDRLLIVDKQNHLFGIISAKTIQNTKDKNVAVSTIMQRDYESVLPSDIIVDILQRVNDDNLSTIPVVDKSGILHGLITKSSLVTTLSAQFIDSQEVV